MRSSFAWLAPFRRTATTTGGLIATTVVTSATGFVFWWLAARYFSRDAVGLAGAAISAMILLSQVAELGLGTKLAGVLHRHERPHALAATALLAGGVSAVVLGLIFSLLIPTIFPELDPLTSHPLSLFIFVGGVALGTVGSILDQLMAAMSQNLRRLIRNIVFSFGRLGLFPLAAMGLLHDGVAIYAVWVAGVAVSFLVLLTPGNARRGRTMGPLTWLHLGRMAGDSMSHHVINLARSSSIWILPLLVTVVLSKEANASFYVALLLANFLALVGSSATFTLYIVAARTPHILWQQIRFTLGVSALVVVVGTAVTAVFARSVLSLFGEAYAVAGYPAIVVLAATTLPVAIKDHWISLQRINGSVRGAAVVGLACLALELVASAAGAAVAGIVGLAVFRLGAVTLQAALMTPAVFRAMTRPPSNPLAVPVGQVSLDPRA
jgi:O-antigen/teichoic acid export membrane protein